MMNDNNCTEEQPCGSKVEIRCDQSNFGPFGSTPELGKAGDRGDLVAGVCRTRCPTSAHLQINFDIGSANGWRMEMRPVIRGES